MNHLTGTYECKCDVKGRLMIASALKKQLAPFIQEGFVMKRAVFNTCIELYPMKEWNMLMGKMNKLNKFKKKNNDFIRKFTAGVKIVQVDASGRLLIPKDLILFAGIKKNVVLSSSINIVEIWDKESFEQVVDDAEVDFATLTEEVMGNIDIDELS
ncbi:MAG: division/cell wall cluster transcriptional repressor MraZ [Flavobacteriales bacterium]|nr:division/cell wall cluster transcriptional repressor MraZ [Flavobacteriales bacterium]